MIQSSIIKSRISRILAMITGMILIIAALAKIFWPAARNSLFGTLAHNMPWLTWSIIAIELLLGLWLITGWRIGGAAMAALLLFSIFSGVILHDMLQHHPQPCGCLGRAWQLAHEPAIIERHLAFGLGRKILLILVAAFIFLSTPNQRQIEQMPIDPEKSISDQ